MIIAIIITMIIILHIIFFWHELSQFSIYKMYMFMFTCIFIHNNNDTDDNNNDDMMMML